MILNLILFIYNILEECHLCLCCLFFPHYTISLFQLFIWWNAYDTGIEWKIFEFPNCKHLRAFITRIAHIVNSWLRSIFGRDEYPLPPRMPLTCKTRESDPFVWPQYTFFFLILETTFHLQQKRCPGKKTPWKYKQ